MASTASIAASRAGMLAEAIGTLGCEPANARAKVLFLITTTDFGGTESILLELAQRLPGLGVEPLVCSLCAPGTVGREIERSGGRVVTLGMSQQPSPREMLAGAWRVARMIDRESVDVVQTLLYRANVVGAVAAPFSRRRPPVISSQRSLNPGGARMSANLVRWTRRFTRLTVAVSEAVRAEMIGQERVAPAHVIVIPNGVDTVRFGLRDRARDRAALGLETSSVLVGGAGRLTTVKGFAVLVEALAIARGEGADVEVAIAGDGPERESLERRAGELGVGDRIRFLGTRRQLERFYGALDVFALPSLQEGSPNALLEAMACGRAAVAAAVGGVPEVVEDGRSGVLVEPGRPDLFARALVRLASDAQERDRLALQARRRVVGEFDVALTAQRHAELYLGLLR